MLKSENSILKNKFLNYTNPLYQGTNLDISDLRTIFFDNFEQQDCGEFLRLLLNLDFSIRNLCLHELVIHLCCSHYDYSPDAERQY